MEYVISIILSLAVGSGLSCWIAKAIIEKIVKDSLEVELKEICKKQKELEQKSLDDDKEILSKIAQIEANYVTCAYCNMQTENTNRLFCIIDTKLNTLIDHSMK